ncbi:ankyrin repeat domain-containing protein 12-like [Harmonia axyridis]|uniref:ankyrin repeat domain-containing protein 12-like n=1 Tax=Harmonia axyridis TaxID=115357 RepID=UPI001E27746A|nr:ankyrin repeat domain-containing protein 12-like [Harmonia axyridis]
MDSVENLPVNGIHDFIMNSGSVKSVSEYIETRKSDFVFLNFYLDALVRKRMREDFTDRDYVAVFYLMFHGAEPMAYSRIGNRRNRLIDLVLKIKDEKLIKFFLTFLKYFDDIDFDPNGAILSEYRYSFYNPVLAAIGYQSMELLQYALKENNQLYQKSFFVLNTALHVAVTMPRLDITRYLLTNRADVEAKNSYGKTPLFCAVEYNRIEQAILLLQYGASMRERDKNDNTVLHDLCSQRGKINYEMFEFLLDIGCDPNSFGYNRLTPLGILAKCNPDEIECAKLLIRRGANVNLQDKFGNTPLHRLVYDCDELHIPAFFNLLIKNGADTKILNHKNKSFLDELETCNYNYKRRIFLKHISLLEIGENLQFLEYPTEFDEHFRNSCEKELKMLKSCRVPEFLTESEYSLIKILISTDIEISRLCRNPTLVTIISELLEGTKFPIYGSYLISKFQSGLKLFSEEEGAVKCITLISGGVLNYSCVKEIMKYIPKKELAVLGKCISKDDELIKTNSSKIQKRKHKKKINNKKEGKNKTNKKKERKNEKSRKPIIVTPKYKKRKFSFNELAFINYKYFYRSI